MFDFAYPHFLYLLGLPLAVAMLFWWARASRRARLRRFGNAAVIAHLMPDASKYTPTVKLVLQLLALVALVIVVCRPRAGQKEQEQTSAGIEVMIAFDVSNSMLASSNDAPDGISRIDRARLLLEKLLDRLDNDKVGLVVFAGESKMQLPLTMDFFSAKMYLNDLQPGMINNQGTSLASAMKMAMNGFSPAKDVHKAIILITDAEDHEGAAVETAKLAAENGIQVDVIGLGSTKGAPIPLPGRPGQYMSDAQGQTVITSVNEEMGQQIASAGDGIYVNGAASNALAQLSDKLDTLAKSEFRSVSYTAAAEQFPTFAWIAFILLIIDGCMVDRKISWLRGVNFFTRENSAGKKALLILLLAGCAAFSSSAASNDTSIKAERNYIREGNKAYADSNWHAALEAYENALAANPRSVRAAYNKALALSHLFSEDNKGTQNDPRVAATEIFNAVAAAATAEEDMEIAQRAFYNLGNIAFNDENYDEAIKRYKQSLRIRPDDLAARQNLRLAQLKKQEQEQNKDNKDNKDDKQNQQQQQQQQQQQEQQDQQQQQQQQQQQMTGSAQQILQSMQNKENATRQKVQKQEAQPAGRPHTDKPW